MKLKPLIEDFNGSATKQFALSLQQVMLERFDQLDVDLKSVDAIQNGWCLVMTPVFERYPNYQPKIDISMFNRQYVGCLVGISRRRGTEQDDDHIFLRPSDNRAGAFWESPNDPELLEALEKKFMQDIARMVTADVNKRVKTSVWDIAEKTDFEPFDYSIPKHLLTDHKIEITIAKAALDGLHVRCTAIPVRKNDPIGSAKAFNDFNDAVLRKQPKPRQILVKVSAASVIFFIYATHEATDLA